MKRLLMVRYGETQWNKLERFIGSADIPLNQEGKDQAYALADRLRDEPNEVIYSSGLQLARETAGIIAKDQTLLAHVTMALREVSYGEWEGCTVKEIEAETGFRFRSRLEAPQVPFPSNPTIQEVFGDIRGFIEHLMGLEEAKTILLVGHGVSFQMILYQLLDIPIRYHWLFYIYNASISEVLVANGEAVLARLNDTHHLKGHELTCALYESQGWNKPGKIAWIMVEGLGIRFRSCVQKNRPRRSKGDYSPFKLQAYT